MTKPFLKWVGGKTRLLSQIIPLLPKKYNRYFEPFVGGGSLYWHLEPKNAYISDLNKELVNTYLAVKYNPQYLIADLRKHINSKEYFFSLRNADRQKDFDSMSAIERASRFIFLNKTGFNGVYNENKKGQAVFGYGYRDNPTIFTLDNIQECSTILQNTIILNGPFDMLDVLIEAEDFVYFDPPYLPENGKLTVRQYTKESTSFDMHQKLYDLCQKLNEKKVYWMMSNSDNNKVRDLFSKFYNIYEVEVPRLIAGDGSKRKIVTELIITNYENNKNKASILNVSRTDNIFDVSDINTNVKLCR